MKAIKNILSFLVLFGISQTALASVLYTPEISSDDKVESIVIPPVDMTCVEVLPNGDVTLNWIPSVPGGGTFIEYQIFCLQNGPVPLANFANLNTTTYTHVGAGGNIGQKDYYVATLSDCGGTVQMSYSDTVSSIFLEINDLGDGRVLLEWNPTHQPQLAGEDLNYNILREFPAGNWQVRKSIEYGQFSYRDTIDICNAFINYRIEVDHANGCKSISNVEGDLVSDVINPYIPVVSRVTVDTVSQNVKVHWDQNQAKDTYGYIILKLINGFWENLDTIYGIANTTYTDLTSITDVQPETYAVAAFDSCIINNVPPNFQTSAAGESHSTIFVESSINICELNMALNWIPYKGWTGGEAVQRYEIMMKKGGDPVVVLGSVVAEKTGYNYNNLEVNETYSFYVRAVSGSGLYSYSNKIVRTIVPPSDPDFHYLVDASFILNDEIEIELYTDADAKPQIYELYKKGPRDFKFNLFQSVAPTGSDTVYFRDNDVSGRGAYEYQIGIIDSCNQTSALTPITKTVFLNVETDNTEFVNRLTWTDYQGFDAQIKEYEIYRSGYETGNFELIADNLPAGTNIYEDKDLFEGNDNGGYCYKILVKENPNQYGFRGEAYSNEVCAALEPVIWVPSAFYPGSVAAKNRVFKPVINLYDIETYQMEIFNREGGKIFTTDDINVGWKGLMPNGGVAQEGVFIYRITFKDIEGRRYEETGPVVFLQE